MKEVCDDRELKIDSFASYIDVVTKITMEQEYRMWYRGQDNYLWGLGTVCSA